MLFLNKKKDIFSLYNRILKMIIAKNHAFWVHGSSVQPEREGYHITKQYAGFAARCAQANAVLGGYGFG